jgi:hypothetical protein
MHNWPRITLSAAVAIIVLGGPIRAHAQLLNSSLIPTFAGVTGDGAGVNFSWWAVKGATGYELLRTPDPQQKPVTIVALPSTTLGCRDAQAGAGPWYYQLVAIQAGGARVASAWFLYLAPTVKSASADGADIVISWSAVKSAPGGYEVWRAPNPQLRPIRVGALSSSTLSYRDKAAGAGPFSYQVVAIGAGGSRAASGWFAFNAAFNAASSGIPSGVSSVPVTAPAANGVVPFAQQQGASAGFGGADAAEKEKADFAAYLKKALQDAGINVSAAELQELGEAIGEGGTAGTELAYYLTKSIATITGDAPVLRGLNPSSGGGQNPCAGDPTNSSGQSCTPTGDPTSSTPGSAPAKITIPQIDQVILGMPTDASTSRLANDLKALLSKLKQ